MNATVIPFRPSDDELERAWREYDRARIHAESLYTIPINTTQRERCEAVLEAMRLYAMLFRLLKRAEGL